MERHPPLFLAWYIIRGMPTTLPCLFLILGLLEQVPPRPQDAQTAGFLNGRGWTFLSTMHVDSSGLGIKVHYVRGVVEAYLMADPKSSFCPDGSRCRVRVTTDD